MIMTSLVQNLRKFRKMVVLSSGPDQSDLIQWIRIHNHGPNVGKKFDFWSVGLVALVQNPTYPQVGPESTLVKYICNISSIFSQLLLQP